MLQIILLSIGVLGASGCAQPPPKVVAPQESKTLRLTGPHPTVVLDVELAKSPAMRQRGLMGRRTLKQNAGMLFVFDEQSEHVFWMHETPLPLDIVFFADDGAFVGAALGAEPNTDAPRSCNKASRYVLEVNAGVATQLGLQKGSRIDLHALGLK